MRVERCAVCATTIHAGDDETCRHGRAFCLACDERDGCEECNGEWLAKSVEEVGTGAGEGAPRQDTGSAWVTRSTDCPEAPAQAHLLGGAS